MPSVVPRSTSASIATEVGSWTFILTAASLMAPIKQADHPAAKSCSGLLPPPALPGEESWTSKRPSLLREAPSRPPVVRVRAV
jgi:hypothetical protein